MFEVPRGRSVAAVVNFDTKHDKCLTDYVTIIEEQIAVQILNDATGVNAYLKKPFFYGLG